MIRPAARQGNRYISRPDDVKKMTNPVVVNPLEIAGTIWQKRMRVKVKGYEVRPVNGAVSGGPNHPLLVGHPVLGAGNGEIIPDKGDKKDCLSKAFVGV